MRKPVLLIFANACILIVVFGLLAQSLFIVQRVAQAKWVKGQVMVQRNGVGDFAILSEGSPVQSGDVVRTGAQSSAEFSWQDGTRWKLNPSSRLVIKKSLFNSLKKEEVSRFDLEEGQVLVRVVKNLAPTSSFEVETPNALVGVQDAILSVSAQQGETDVSVFKGSAEVSQSGKNSRFSAMKGQGAKVSASGIQIRATENQSEFLAPPTLLLPELEVKLRTLQGGALWLKGHTEVGNRVSINGEGVPLLGNGVFVKRIEANAKVSGGWKIESTDRYGATASVFKPFVDKTIAPVTTVTTASVIAVPIGAALRRQCP
ncbi:FecR family protein [Abditibacterium utsteinense]|uniref:FecR family protein n=1 Tax=Abditibacterium utsteinense TaxID=1960156 RepID=A0A2S8SSB1_9BACT|nr:FecR family protein [Abditibacterium utsteinense]PQV63677.1 FecR family protein [Abditibacterium utsteinense]